MRLPKDVTHHESILTRRIGNARFTADFFAFVARGVAPEVGARLEYGTTAREALARATVQFGTALGMSHETTNDAMQRLIAAKRLPEAEAPPPSEPALAGKSERNLAVASILNFQTQESECMPENARSDALQRLHQLAQEAA